MTRISKPKTNAIQIVCHRGANQFAPENTYASAARCIAWGMDYVEIDVNTSADGVMYVFHGPGLERTTNGTGNIYDMDSGDVDQLDCGSWFSPAFAGERIPRLTEFLTWVDHRIKLFFDVKWADLEQLVRLVESCGLSSDCFFWFGNNSHAHALHALAPDLALKMNVWAPADVELAVATFGASIVELRVSSMDTAMKAKCTALGVRTMVMHTRDEPEIYDEIIRWSPDMVNVDHGDRFLSRLRKVG